MKVGFVGTGRIASAMVRSLTGSGHEIFVSNRGAEASVALASELFDVQRCGNEKIASDCDIVILCLMATTAKRILPSLQFRPGVRLISVMVDIELATLQQIAPGAASVDITIPLPQIASGGCPLPCFPSNETVDLLFGPENPSFIVKDLRALNAHFGASALMSTTLDQIETASTWLSEFSGDEEVAQFYLSHMIASALATIGPSSSLTQMLTDLSTEGGLNISLKDHMRTKGTQEALRDGLDRFTRRLGL